MTKEFKYRPQYSLLLLGLGGLVTSFYLLPAIGLDEIGFSFLTGLLGLGSLILTIVFLILFARQLGPGNLRISTIESKFQDIGLKGPSYIWTSLN